MKKKEQIVVLLEYNFMKIINEHISFYKELLIPAVICDSSFTVHWSNSAAKMLFPHLTVAEGIRGLLAEFDPDDLLDRMKRDGTCRIDGVFAFSGVRLNLMPILHDGEIAGSVVFIVAPQSVVNPADLIVSSKTPVMLEESVRRVVEKFFGVMDYAALKADMLDAGWVKPSLAGLAQGGYELLRIVSNISHYTQYQAAPPVLSLRAVGLFDLLRESAKAVTGIAGGMDIPVRFELPEDPGVSGIDPDKFLLAFFNILHNSLYFTRPENSIDIIGDSTGRELTVTVRDRGVGIAEGILPNIFRPYFSSGLNGRPAGVGLGLTLAKIIIEAHGGSLTVHSKENEGTSAVIMIPKGASSKQATLGQNKTAHLGSDRFSRVYVGLSDADSSPYRNG